MSNRHSLSHARSIKHARQCRIRLAWKGGRSARLALDQLTRVRRTPLTGEGVDAGNGEVTLVERLIQAKLVDGIFWYKVHWKHCRWQDWTWEPETSILIGTLDRFWSSMIGPDDEHSAFYTKQLHINTLYLRFLIGEADPLRDVASMAQDEAAMWNGTREGHEMVRLLKTVYPRSPSMLATLPPRVSIELVRAPKPATPPLRPLLAIRPFAEPSVDMDVHWRLIETALQLNSTKTVQINKVNKPVRQCRLKEVSLYNLSANAVSVFLNLPRTDIRGYPWNDSRRFDLRLSMMPEYLKDGKYLEERRRANTFLWVIEVLNNAAGGITLCSIYLLSDAVVLAAICPYTRNSLTWRFDRKSRLPEWSF